MRSIRPLVVAVSLFLASCGSCDSNTPDLSNGTADANGTPNNTMPDGGTPGDGGATNNNATDPWSDADGDGIVAQFDNCPDDANDDQADGDSDGVGDLCDNCVDQPNFDQNDEDDDGTGDVCEEEPAGEICGTQQNEFELIKPNIYLVIDRSTSMRNDDGTGDSRMTRARAGLDQIGDNSADSVRFGISVYPCAREGDACDQLNKEILPIGDYTLAEFKASYTTDFDANTCPHGNTGTEDPGLDVEEGGRHCTESGAALSDVLDRMLLSDPMDPLDAQREKAVVIITDGGACGCGAQDATVQAASDLAAAGIPVYVVGFNFDDMRLDAVAMAGGTDAGAPGPPRFYRASNADQLAAALNDIESLSIPCSFELDPEPEDPNRLWVSVDGNFLDRDTMNGFVYDEDTNTVTLNGDACDALKMADPMDPPLEIISGCAGETCAPVGAECSEDSDCCNAACIDGTCQKRCHPTNTACRTNDDCCRGVCAKMGSGVGVCQGG